MTKRTGDWLDEAPRDELRELVGRLGDYILDREPPISEKEEGELVGLRIAIDEIQYLVEHGEVRTGNRDDPREERDRDG